MTGAVLDPMTPERALDALLHALREVAPESPVATLGPHDDLAEHLGLDSLDFLRVVELVRGRTGVAIPDDRFPDVATTTGFTRVLVALARAAGGGLHADGRARP